MYLKAYFKLTINYFTKMNTFLVEVLIEVSLSFNNIHTGIYTGLKKNNTVMCAKYQKLRRVITKLRHKFCKQNPLIITFFSNNVVTVFLYPFLIDFYLINVDI